MGRKSARWAKIRMPSGPEISGTVSADESYGFPVLSPLNKVYSNYLINSKSEPAVLVEP